MKNKECTICKTKIGRNSRSLLCDVHLKSKYYFAHKEKTAEYAKKYRIENSEKLAKKKKEYQQRDPDRFRKMRAVRAKNLNGRFQAGKKTARYRGKIWSLTKEEFVSIAKDASCVYCNVKIVGYGHGLDRVDNDRGYESNNVVPCCGPCNSIRGNYLTFDEMKVAMAAVVNYRKNLQIS